jgi:hypothetical protein
VDNERVYWANHGYYSPNVPVVPRPLYSEPKNGGAVETFTEPQMLPGSVTVDEKFVYWTTAASIVKKAKTGGDPIIVYQAGEKEGIDKLTQDTDSLYFGYRGPGESSWALRKIAKSGGEALTLVKSFSLSPAVVDEQYVYFFDEDSTNKHALCRIAKQGGEVQRLDSGYSGGAISQSKTQLFFAGLDDIYSFSK